MDEIEDVESSFEATPWGHARLSSSRNFFSKRETSKDITSLSWTWLSTRCSPRGLLSDFYSRAYDPAGDYRWTCLKSALFTKAHQRDQ